MVARYGPDETWPKHDRPFWNDALAVARAAGWTLTKLEGHWWGRVECPAGVHAGSVDKTALGSETKANELKKDVHGCPHGTGGTGSKVRERADRCEALLGRVNELLDLADRAVERLEAQRDTYDELEILYAQETWRTRRRTSRSCSGGRTVAEALDDAWERAAALDDVGVPQHSMLEHTNFAATIYRPSTRRASCRSRCRCSCAASI